jgi:hypothetical protein
MLQMLYLKKMKNLHLFFHLLSHRDRIPGYSNSLTVTQLSRTDLGNHRIGLVKDFTLAWISRLLVERPFSRLVMG